MQSLFSTFTTVPEVVTQQCQQWCTLLHGTGTTFPEDSYWTEALLKVFDGSEFVARILLQEPQLFADLMHSNELTSDYLSGEQEDKLRAILTQVNNESQLSVALRRFRRRQMVRIVWRDLAGWASLDTTLEDLSALADACIVQTLELLHAWQVRDIGNPETLDGESQRLLVLGMGKLGARELNLSSDIDLIFAFPGPGPVRGVGGKLSHSDSEQFFTRLAQRLLQALQQQTAEGFVFRVDVRLRPFGDAGPLVLSLSTLDVYYQTQARDWERYAMVKARLLAGDLAISTQLMQMIQPFVYRRYLDFAAIESLRELKRLIAQEVVRKGLEDNIKLGPGGIREIEFIGQVFQIIRGGRETELQIRPIVEVLQLLGAKGLLPSAMVSDLISAYRFLRCLENRLQAWRDQQTHSLPGDITGRARLARSMGYADWDNFLEILTQHRQQVQLHFDAVFANSNGETLTNPYTELWCETLELTQAESTLTAAGFADPTATIKRLQLFRSSATCRTIGNKGRFLLDQLMPSLLSAVAGKVKPDLLLERLLQLIEAIAKRTAYLALLVESSMALTQLVKLAADSSWVIAQLTRCPLLLDELMDPRRLYAPQKHKELLIERDSILRSLAPDDQEQQMERLRQFAQSNRLRVAAADLAGMIPLMVVSDYLTDLAEVTLDTALEQCWSYLTLRHGKPTGLSINASGFAIIGYGKLGGIELGYSSDLDLVFLHGNANQHGETAGPNPIPNSVFYVRLAQRLIHTLSTRTPSGILYEVDARLRPNGKAGLLVSSVDAFAHYQEHTAWTWEHQAILRARPIAGDPEVRTKFRTIRMAVITQKRDPLQLRVEIGDMRAKMRSQLDRSRVGLFDLKQGYGGIVDIEFIVQYQVLRWASSYPDLADWTDTIRWLETLAHHALLSCDQATILADSYRALRGTTHRLTLQNDSDLVADTYLKEQREQVQAIWKQILDNITN